MHVTVIGGSGFIGSVLIEKMGEEGDKKIINVDKSDTPPLRGESVKCDIRSQKDLEASLDEQTDWVILLAAEHRDDVSPVSLYYDVNVQGTDNVLEVMRKKGINRILFTSSVAVYGLNKENPSEETEIDPFNHYGKSKWEAEELLRRWYDEDRENRTLVIIRPTVVFGPNNKGNVYNLLKQISSGRFLRIGKGENRKSMAYVDNIVGFIKYCVNRLTVGYYLYNYADKPDLTTNELIAISGKAIGKNVSEIKIPYCIGYAGGVFFDLVSKVTGKKLPISAVRVRKFCATTQFSSEKMQKTGYVPPFTLKEGLEITIKSILNK